MAQDPMWTFWGTKNILRIPEFEPRIIRVRSRLAVLTMLLLVVVIAS